MTDHTLWDELAAGYALHGLSPEEQVTFAEHLETCDRCTASVNDHELVAAQLGSISHYRDDDRPPSWASMRDAIVGPREPVAAGDELAGRRQRRYDLSRRSLAAAAAAAVIAGGGVAAWQLTTSAGSSCSASDGCHVIELDAAGGKPAASLEVRGDTVTMDAAKMPVAPVGSVYVLWQQPSDGQATPIKEFSAAAGASTVTASLSVPYSDTQGFAVSLETATGAPPATPSNSLASGTAT